MKLATLDLLNHMYLEKENQEEIILHPGESIDVDSYHNSFFESYWTKYTNVKSIELNISVVGKGMITIIRNQNGIESIIHSTFFSSETLSLPIKLEKHEQSRIYFQINAQTDVTIKNNADWSTSSIPEKIIKLAVIMCTYNKQEYIQRNLKTLLSHLDFLESDIELYIVDNASNLNLQSNQRLHYFAQDNYGGTGGFTRGLIEARKTQRFSHYQFMDDDILLDPDSVLRAKAFMSYTTCDYAFSGAMLCMDKKNQIWESGADYVNSPHAFAPSLHFRNRILNKELFNDISRPYDFEYGGWWFFCFSETTFQKIGYPMPFFIRADDVEFQLRLKKFAIKNICLPGIGVWHETFETKKEYWLQYYNFRNYFILNAIHKDSLKFFFALLRIWVSFIYCLLSFNFKKLICHTQALQDALTFPEKFVELSTPRHQEWVMSHFKNLENHNKIFWYLPLKLIFYCLKVLILFPVLRKRYSKIQIEFSKLESWEKFLKLS